MSKYKLLVIVIFVLMGISSPFIFLVIGYNTQTLFGDGNYQRIYEFILLVFGVCFTIIPIFGSALIYANNNETIL